MEPIISLDQVSKSLSGRRVLSDISLNTEKGSAVDIVGSNGGGKSVLLDVICGFLVPDSDQVRVRGRVLGKGRDFPENIRTLINSPDFIGLNTGFQNLRYLIDTRGVAGEKGIRLAMQKIGPDPKGKVRVEHYSLGMKQKPGITQAIMENQDILILDKPFNALDYKTYNDIKKIIRVPRAEGRTILMTSHDYDDLEALCTHIYAIEDGELGVLSGEEIKERFRE